MKLVYKITFKKSVAKDLRKIDKKEAESILNRILQDLPNLADSLPELKGKFTGLKKYRVGNYRIIFTILNNAILIVRIGNRKDVYRKM